MQDIDPRRLSQLMSLANMQDLLVWPEEDRAALFRHQMGMSLSSSGNHSNGQGYGAATAVDASPSNALTWHDVFAAPEPSPELLLAAKDIAKDLAKHGSLADEPSVPPEIATVLYYAVIAVGLVQLNIHLTSLNHAALRAGFQWGAQQSWVDERVSTLFERGLEALGDESE